ncbi:MAG: LPS assembly lipoprotein LptE [Leptospirales bacterium]
MRIPDQLKNGPNRGPITRATTVILILLSLSACGYHPMTLEGVTRTPQTVKLGFSRKVTIAVKTFHNNTIYPFVESEVTQVLKNTLQRSSGVRLINDPKRADVVLTGIVVGINEIPFALSSVVGIEQYQVEVILSASLVAFNGQVLWTGGSIMGTAPMYMNQNLALIQQTQQYALNAASQNAAERVIQQMAHNIGSSTYIPIQNQTIGTPTPGPMTGTPAPPGSPMPPGGPGQLPGSVP